MVLSATAVIGLINLVLIVLVAIVNHLNHVKLTTNDLHHLSMDVKEIKEKQVGIEKYVSNLAIDLSYVKGKCDMHTSKIFKKSKKILNKETK
jgi:hypothetical protein